MEVIWRSNPIINNYDVDVRIIDLEGEKILELVATKPHSFGERIKRILKYLLFGVPIVTHMVLLDDEFDSMCEKVIKNDRENS